MDTFSHALWGKGLFGYRGYGKLAIFFGAMPDLVSFGLLFAIQILDGTYVPGAPKLNSIPDWLFFNYDVSHSYVTAFFFLFIAYKFNKRIAFAMLGWPFHILLDFPFHSKEYFPTKIFYPFTDFSFDGIPWTSPEVWFPNIAGILVLFAYRTGYYKKYFLGGNKRI